MADEARCDRSIFIHSLWRAGSTFMFSAFRRSAGLWCYQEPLHEYVLQSREAPSELLLESLEKSKALRHPPMDVPYFLELYKTWDSWHELISKPIIYDQYFDNVNNREFIAYLNALVTSCSGRPVVQECRTAGRMSGIREALGGYHIYLWRNPWDQWWSYKVASYFDTTTRLILNAPLCPEAIARLRQEIGFVEFHDEEISKEFSHFTYAAPTAKDSYMAFYLLWCLGLLEGLANADLLLNIDSLTDSPDYRSEVEKRLADIGVRDVDFRDCNVPQAYYMDEDAAFFTDLEERIHAILTLSGYSRGQLSNLLTLRQQSQPRLWSLPMSDIPVRRLLRDCSRARGVVVRKETEYSGLMFQLCVQKNQQAAEIDALVEKQEQITAERDRRLGDIDDLAARTKVVESELGFLRGELLHLAGTLDRMQAMFLRKPVSWVEYDAAYYVWKEYRKRHISRHEALEAVGKICGVRLFFFLYPLYKAAKPIWKCKRFLSRQFRKVRKSTAAEGFDAARYFQSSPGLMASGADPFRCRTELSRAESVPGRPRAARGDGEEIEEMFESSCPEIGIDEIMAKIREEVARRRSSGGDR